VMLFDRSNVTERGNERPRLLMVAEDR